MVQILSNLVICVCWKRRQKRQDSAALCWGTPKPWRAPQLCLCKGKALLTAQRNNMGLAPAAGLTKHGSHRTPVPALLCCLGRWLAAGANPGLPPSPTRMKEVMGLQRVSGLSLHKDGGVCSNPVVKPSCSVSGEEGKAQLGAATQEHPSTARASSKQDSSRRTKAGWVLHELFLIRNYRLFLIRSYSSCLALCLLSSSSHAPNATSGTPEPPLTHYGMEEGAQRPRLCSARR